MLAMQVPINVVVWQNPRWLWPADDGNQALLALGWPGRAYSELLLPVRQEGITPQALVPVGLMIVITVAIVVMARMIERTVNEP